MAEEELERFLEVAEDLQVRGLTLSGGGGDGHDGDQERRVSGGDLDTAVDDDVNDLLAGLDNDQVILTSDWLTKTILISDWLTQTILIYDWLIRLLQVRE